MQGQLDKLDRRVVAGLDAGAGGQGDLRQADGARVGVLAGSDDLEGRYHRIRHVGRAVVGPVCSEAEIYIHEGRGMALEPAWLESDGATCRGPECAVSRRAHASACIALSDSAAWQWETILIIRDGLTGIHPLHSVWESLVCY
jgi:hypothetical protein